MLHWVLKLPGFKSELYAVRRGPLKCSQQANPAHWRKRDRPSQAQYPRRPPVSLRVGKWRNLVPTTPASEAGASEAQLGLHSTLEPAARSPPVHQGRHNWDKACSIPLQPQGGLPRSPAFCSHAQLGSCSNQGSWFQDILADTLTSPLFLPPPPPPPPNTSMSWSQGSS